MINKKIKSALIAVIFVVALFSMYSYATVPITATMAKKGNIDNLSSLSVVNNYTQVNLSDMGQTITANIYFSTKIPPWNQEIPFGATIRIAKVSESASFPFSDETLIISGVHMIANGTQIPIQKEYVDKISLLNTDLIQYSFLLDPYQTIDNVNLTVTYYIQIVLLSGIYHFAGEKRLIRNTYYLQ